MKATVDCRKKMYCCDCRVSFSSHDPRPSCPICKNLVGNSDGIVKEKDLDSVGVFFCLICSCRFSKLKQEKKVCPNAGMFFHEVKRKKLQIA